MLFCNPFHGPLNKFNIAINVVHLSWTAMKEDTLMRMENGKERDISRRGFLMMAGGTIGTISLGSMPLAESSYSTEIEFPGSKCGEKGKMGKKVLVGYASKYGSTAGVADAIGKELCDRGATVDVCTLKNVRDLNEYKGVVLGSPVYKGKWLPEAVDFVERNRGVLQNVSVAYFLVCITMCKPTRENRQKALAYLDPVLKAVPQVQPVKVGPFAGALDYGNLSSPIKLVMKLKGAPEGDFRPWDDIRAWATGLYEIHGLEEKMTSS
jgi:menaquinone-dependent protoporphyrinogen oxidase